jgi:hypothetical protein
MHQRLILPEVWKRKPPAGEGEGLKPNRQGRDQNVIETPAFHSLSTRVAPPLCELTLV